MSTAGLYWALLQRNGFRLLYQCPALVIQAVNASSTVSAQVQDPTRTMKDQVQDQPRTMKDLPHVSFMELVYRLMIQGYYNRMHELQLLEKRLYGNIYRDGLKGVAINTPGLLEEVLRNDEKFPKRGDMEIWKEYRDLREIGYGPFTEEGEKWYQMRSLLNKRMLHPKESAQYGTVISAVVRDFIQRIQDLRQRSETGDRVDDIANELYRFSLEGIASILFETRIGCLQSEIPSGTQEFINSIMQMFSYSPAVMVMPRWTRTLLPYWDQYCAGWEGIFTFAKTLVDRKLEQIERRLEEEEVEGEYLTYLLSNTDMKTTDVYGSVTELLLAGVDTTSNTLTWTLHLLSTHPEVQARLHQEVSQIQPHHWPSAEEVTRLQYLRATIKETLRLYPVVPMNARILSEKDVVIGGYHFPKKTPFIFCHYAISHDEHTFPSPFSFHPERWLRDGRPLPNPFGSIPFGFGVRGCVGRRIAELEMYMALFHMVRQYEIRPDPSVGEVKSLNRIVLVPNKKLNLHFVKRASAAV